MKLKSFLITFLFLSSFSYGVAQFSQENMRLLQRPKPVVMFEMAQYASSDTGKFTVDIYYRIDLSFFSLINTSPDQSGEEYNAKGEFTIELLNEKRSTAAREYRAIEFTSHGQNTESANQNDLQGIAVFHLIAGKYQIVAETKDMNSDQEYINKDHILEINPSALDSLWTSTPVFVTPEKDSLPFNKETFRIMNRGANVYFASTGGTLLQIVKSNPKDSIHISWNLHNEKSRDNDGDIQLSGNECIPISQGLVVKKINDALFYIPDQSSNKGYFLYIPLPLERLEPGIYRCEFIIRAGSQISKQKITFHVIWPNKPSSLSDPTVSIDALRYIATEDEVDDMSTVFSSKGTERFKVFWKKRNPDTTKAFNPVMAEFYRRVDEAIHKYSSENSNDGYKSDRGRVLILFGDPTKTVRTFKPNSDPTEIWTYKRLHKRFIFTDLQRFGTYTLVKTEDF